MAARSKRTDWKQPSSVLNGCILVQGVRRGSLTAAKIAQLAIAQVQLGHWPTVEEYAEFWSIDERTAWRHRAACREVYPGERLRFVVDQVAAICARQKFGRGSVREVVARMAG